MERALRPGGRGRRRPRHRAGRAAGAARPVRADRRRLPSPDELMPLLEAGDARRRSCSTSISSAARPTAARASISWRGSWTMDPDAAVVIITAHGAVSIAVEAIKRGASDFVAKPWANERLAATVRSAAALRPQQARGAGRAQPRRPSSAQPARETPLLGKSEAMKRVRQLIERAAPTDANVLILGENGTGKEIVAREIHRLSRRSGQADGRRSTSARPARACSNPSCSATSRAPSPAPRPTASAGSRPPTTAPCSSTRSAICRCICSPSC